MSSELAGVPEHMAGFASSLFGHALWHVIMAGGQAEQDSAKYGVLHVAHGGELLLKAAIAHVDPLRIFSKLPAKKLLDPLSFDDLMKSRTLTYAELPKALAAVSGFELPNPSMYLELGRIRNAIQHFVVEDVDFKCLVLSYLCTVVDPVLQRFWGIGVFEAIVESWDQEDSYMFDDDPYVLDALDDCKISFSGWVPHPGNRGQRSFESAFRLVGS